jgi:hypothetical protein
LIITNQIENFQEILNNKFIIGNSAGSVMWSNFYYEPEAKEIRKGNAFLPIKTIVHR